MFFISSVTHADSVILPDRAQFEFAVHQTHVQAGGSGSVDVSEILSSCAVPAFCSTKQTRHVRRSQHTYHEPKTAKFGYRYAALLDKMQGCRIADRVFDQVYSSSVQM